MNGLLRRVLAFAALLSPGAAPAQHLGGATESGISLPSVIAALIACVGAAVALAFAMRSRTALRPMSFASLFSMSPTSQRRLRLVEGMRVSPHAELRIVQCDDVEYLLLCSTTGCQILDRKSLAFEGDEHRADGKVG